MINFVLNKNEIAYIMKKSVLTLFAVAALTLTACNDKKAVDANDALETNEATETAVKYNVDIENSQIDWAGGKVAGGGHTGTIALEQGEVFVEDGKVTTGKFVIDMKTITVTDLTEDTGKADLEAHLKGESEDKADHFFNVSKFPTATFELVNVKDSTVEGNLTMKGQTNSIEFPATVTVTDNDVTIASDEFEIDRTKWGVNFNSGSVFQDLAGDKIIKDNIKVKFTVKATK